MSTPENNSATPANQETQDSLEQKVNAAVSQSTFDEATGTVSLPDELKDTLDADTLYAVTLEHRRRNTQSSYTKNKQQSKATEAKNEKLLEILSGHTKVEISEEDQERLDALKFEDPDKWRSEMNKLERQATGESRAKIDELTGEASKAAEQSFELDRRQQVLNEFNESAEVQITEELIANEVPLRITNKLAEGKITFEDFLVVVETYVTTGKSVKNDNTLDQPNMGDLGGGKSPSDMKPEKGLEENYKNDLY